MDWKRLFPNGAPVVALPSWHKPRLVISAESAQSLWAASEQYPAYKATARIYRLLLRAKATLKVGQKRNIANEYILKRFLDSAGLGMLQPLAILIAASGPAQKLVIALRNETGGVVAYIKYSEYGDAIKRIRYEHSLLKKLPHGLAPEPRYIGPLGKGVGLLVSALPGRALSPSGVLSNRIVRFASSMPVKGRASIEAHPWIVRLVAIHGDQAMHWVKPLVSKSWAIVPQHGDFAPWNILLDKTGTVRAIDWEYGTLQGFPGTDLAFYILQQGALIYGWHPKKARERAIAQLAKSAWPGVGGNEAEAITRLAALEAYLRLEEGRASSATRAWWKAVWGGN